MRRSDTSVLVVDNYDSFTHNIIHALALAGATCRRVRNDELSAAELLAAGCDGIVLSAGPCTPSEAGVCLALVEALLAPFAPRLPLLGICLGHQTIAQALGARVVHARRPMHGKVTRVRHDGRGCLSALPQPAQVVRYNSLSVDEATLPDALEACAWAEDGDLMALRHRQLPLEGVQFHPESWLSPATSLIGAWVGSCRAEMRRAG